MSLGFWLWGKSIELQKGIEDRKSEIAKKQAAKMKLTTREHQNWLYAIFTTYLMFVLLTMAVLLVLKVAGIFDMLNIWVLSAVLFIPSLILMRTIAGRKLSMWLYKLMLAEDAKKQPPKRR